MDEKCIPEEIFLYIMQYLEPVDCLSWAHSRTSKRFSSFYLRRQRSWNLPKCYSASPNLCLSYLSSASVSSHITELDFSHCFWLPSATLINSLTPLKNLTDLNIADTKLNVTQLPEIFKHCPQIVRLSVDVVERTWTELVAKIFGINWNHLKNGFKTLQSLRLYILDVAFPDTWLLILRLLTWCVNCTDLHLELCYAQLGCPFEHGESTKTVVKFARESLYNELNWTANLKRLSYGRRGYQSYSDGCLDDWCWWIINKVQPKSLEFIWLPFVKNVRLDHPQPALKSFCLGRNIRQSDLDRQMPHVIRLAGVNFSSFVHLPQLRLFQGHCSSFKELSEFCQKHSSRMEHLHFDDESETSGASSSSSLFQCQWALPRLRTLIYNSRCPHSDVITKLTSSCPNLEVLHLGRRLSSHSQSIFITHQEPDETSYKSIANCKKLTKLTISGIEFTRGQFLQQILQSCCRLQCLHLSGQFDDDTTFHQDLCSYLPLARNLRDFRLQREELEGNQLLQILSSLESCSRLERLVIYQEAWSARSASLSALLPDVIVGLVQRLTRLTALCLVYPIEPSAVQVTASRLNREIKAIRPAFWFHLADDLPDGTGHPRIHLHEIVDPDYSADFLDFRS